MINKFLPLVGVAVVLALFIVWESVQTTKCGYTVASLQKKIVNIQEKNRRLEFRINVLKKPERIARVVQSLKLDLAQPLENRVITAKTKQRLTPEKSKPTKNIVYATARSELNSQHVNSSQRGVRKKHNRR